jgi:acylphosphatase
MLFTGRVQGVGFRYTTEHIAARHAVTGFVRNLDDGRVEAVVEGSRAEVDRFQHAVEEAMASNIRETTVVDGPAGGEFTRFSITF